MPMAPAAARPPPPGLLSKSSFSLPCPGSAAAAAATTARLGRRRAGGSRTAILGVAPRSVPRDGWGADSFEGGRLVDEDMATLRRRIREARAAAAAEEDIDNGTDAGAGVGLPLPAGWTELERRHHRRYVAGVRGAAGLLEALLVSARPGLGAGLVALLLLGVPASLFLVWAQLITAVDSIASAGLNGR